MSKRRVLVVGGDPDVTRTLQVYLEAHQFSVQMVNTGHEALAACRQLLPDALILSWHLPDMEGNNLCRQLRGAVDSFILALLPYDDRNTRLAALDAGADDVTAHPIDIEEIRLRIEEVSRL